MEQITTDLDYEVTTRSRKEQVEKFKNITKCPACKADSVLVAVEFSRTGKAYGFYRCTGYANHVFEEDEPVI